MQASMCRLEDKIDALAGILTNGPRTEPTGICTAPMAECAVALSEEVRLLPALVLQHFSTLRISSSSSSSLSSHGMFIPTSSASSLSSAVVLNSSSSTLDSDRPSLFSQVSSGSSFFPADYTVSCLKVVDLFDLWYFGDTSWKAWKLSKGRDWSKGHEAVQCGQYCRKSSNCSISAAIQLCHSQLHETRRQVQ